MTSLCGSGCRGQPTARSPVSTAHRGRGGWDTIPQAPTAIGHPALSSPELLSLTVDCARRVPPPGIRYIESVRVNVGNPMGLHTMTPQVTHKGLGHPLVLSRHRIACVHGQHSSTVRAAFLEPEPQSKAHFHKLLGSFQVFKTMRSLKLIAMCFFFRDC